jgi:hypothetical protein
MSEVFVVVFGSFFLVLFSWCLVLGAWVLGVWVLGAWFLKNIKKTRDYVGKAISI